MVDPNVQESFNIVLSFIKYYKTEEYLKLALPFVLKGIESRLDPLKSNKSLNGTTSFDYFIKACHEHCKANNFDLFNLVLILIYGTISDYSTELFYEFFNNDLFNRSRIHLTMRSNYS